VQLLYAVRWLADAPVLPSSRLPSVHSASTQLQLSLCQDSNARRIVCSTVSSGKLPRKRMQQSCPQPGEASSVGGALWAAAASLQALQESSEQVMRWYSFKIWKYLGDSRVFLASKIA